MASIEMRGLDRALNRLDLILIALSGDIRRVALQAGGLLIMNDAKRRVAKRSGNLARSLHVGGMGGSGGLEGNTTGSDIGGRGDDEVAVGTNVVYAKRIEYGFDGVDALGRRYNQPAQPYLRPAAESQRAAAIAEVNRTLREQLERIRA